MKLGDHVRALVNGEYRHGIDCGDRTVLFLGRDTSGRPEVRRALAADFAAERVETVVHRERVLAPRVVVARAFSRMRDPAAAASFVTSEAFAVWCLTGRPAEPGYAPAAAPASARKAPARRAAPKRRVRKAVARSSATPRPRKKAPARRPASRGKRRR